MKHDSNPRKHLARTPAGFERPVPAKKTKAEKIERIYKAERRCGYCGDFGHDLRNCIDLLEKAG